MNFIKTESNNGKIDILNNRFDYPAAEGRNIVVGVRPEDVAIVEGDDFRVELVENLGSEKLVYLTSDKFGGFKEIISRCGSESRYSIGESCSIKLYEKGIHVFDADSEKRI